MKKKLIIAISLAFALLMVFGTAVSAFAPYETYTYSISGDPMPSPSAYEASQGSVHTDVTMSQYGKAPFTTGKEEEGGYTSLFADLCTDSKGWIYISDKRKNRVIALNQNYKAQYIISTFASDLGPSDTLEGPTGLFATDDYLYVCDTGNQRIVAFNTADGTYHKNIAAPESKVFKDGWVFSPIAVAVDKFGKLFVVSETTTEGVIVMDEDSTFTGYIGAQKVVVNAFDRFFRRFKSEEERKEDIQNIATNLKNITLEHGDYGDFLYVVSDSVDEAQQESAIKSKEADYSPVRKLNNKGDEIMKRNGFFDCGGEVNVRLSGDDKGVSKIVDVATGPRDAGTWSIIDRVRRKVYTYDRSGQLLFVFGDMSGQDNKEKPQMGQIAEIGAIDYQYDSENGTYNILLLDTNSNSFTAFTCTDYGEQLLGAIVSDNNLNYAESKDRWKKILESNNNFDAAYIGYGKALYNNKEYDEALVYLAAAKETEIYSETLKAQSQERISSNVLFPLLIVAAVLIGIFIVVKIFGYAKRVNYEGNFKKKHTYWEELIYAFYVIFHPFDGFWDIKHEARGTVRGGLTILGINILAFYYQNIGRSYLANPTGAYSPFWTQIAAVGLPVILWAVANWCLTTLFDGEAKFKHVFVSACYALAPLPVFVVAGTIITNISNTVGDSIVTLVTAIGYVWVAFLLFFGTLVVQDYSLGKNVFTTIGTILCMVVIMFVVILFASLVGDMVGFVSNIVTEISYRT